MASIQFAELVELAIRAWKSPCRLRNCPVRGRLEMTGMGSWRDSGEWQVFSSLNWSEWPFAHVNRPVA
jgi:hypothetical protein